MCILNISVIIPTYNRAHLLAKSVESVLRQTLEPLEIIIVDDFSTDNTKEIVESFHNEKIKYVTNQRTKGANGARNTGVLIAKGDFIAFQDSDDVWLPAKLDKQFSFMKDNMEADMCFCSLNLLNSVRGVVPKRKVLHEEIMKQLEKGNFISTQTIFIKKEIAKKVLFDESLKRFQDWDFVLRVARNYSIHHLDEVLVMVEVQDDSISKVVDETEALSQFFTKHPDLREANMVNKSLNNKVLLKTTNGELIKSVKYFVKYFGYKYVDKALNRGTKL